MSGLVFRRATLADLDFVATAIIEAERSGTGHTVYERVFDLPPDALRALVESLLREEIPGSELCCDNFVLALADGAPVGGIATWIEAQGNPPSSIVRANMLAWALGAERWRAAQSRLQLLAAVDVPRAAGALQVESVYVVPSHRGGGVTRAIIEHAIAECRAAQPEVEKAQILSVVENEPSRRAFSRAGFTIARRIQSESPELAALFPGTGRLLWERSI